MVSSNRRAMMLLLILSGVIISLIDGSLPALRFVSLFSRAFEPELAPAFAVTPALPKPDPLPPPARTDDT